MKGKHFLLSMAVSFVLMLCASACVQAAGDTVRISYSGKFDYDKAYEILQYTNELREASQNADPLVLDTELMKAAMQRAAELQLVYNKSGKRPDMATDFHALSSKALAENITVGQPSAKEAFQVWENSTVQRSNIINRNYVSVGIGCFHQGSTVCWVELFGTEEAVSPSRSINQTQTVKVDVDKDLFLSSAKMVGVSGVGSDFTVKTTKAAVVGISFMSTRPNFSTYGPKPVKLLLDNFKFSSDHPKILMANSNGTLSTGKVGEATLTFRHKKAKDVSVSQKFMVTNAFCREIVFDPNGGKIENATSGNGRLTAYVEKGNAYGKLPKVSRKGYIFRGWYTKLEGGTRIKKTTKVAAAKDTIKTLYARWEKIEVDKMAKPSLRVKDDTKLQVKWDMLSKADGYRIVLSTSAKFSNRNTQIVDLEDSSASSYTFKNLTPGKTYYVHVRAYRLDPNGNQVNGKFSATESIKLSASRVPA